MSQGRGATLGSVIFGAVVGAVVLGLLFVAFGPWRFGVGLMGCGLAGAGVGRLLIPDRAAGQLRVRRRFSDSVWLLGLGALLVVLAILVPEQPPL